MKNPTFRSIYRVHLQGQNVSLARNQHETGKKYISEVGILNRTVTKCVLITFHYFSTGKI
jgi:hypothetical protein